MSRSRATSEVSKSPHSVSLKVLRLSRPQLSSQFPLPISHDEEQELQVDSQAALSYPSSDPNDHFILSPLLTLPPSFGTTHVGETFSCTLCANNELSDAEDQPSISGVRIIASMQTPSQPDGISLDLSGVTNEANEGSPLGFGKTLQRMVKFELREEGNHILAVTLSYIENHKMQDGQTVEGGRARTFRKLYQFAAQQLLSVRTKSSVMPSKDATKQRYALEAQLENLSDQAVILESIEMLPKEWLSCKSMNVWERETPDDQSLQKPLLSPGHVLQSAFLLQEEANAEETLEYSADGRAILGQLSLQWRSAMGDLGSLSTGWLSCKRK